MERMDFDFEYLYDNRDDLETAVKDAIMENFDDLSDIASGLDFDIDDLPGDLSDAKDFLVDCQGMEEPDIYDDVDTIFEGKSHYDIMCMMYFGDEDFNPTHQYFTLNGYGNFGASSNSYEELLESEMPETRDVLDFAESVKENIAQIVDEVVKTAQLKAMIMEFAEENGMEYEDYSDTINLSIESDAGVTVSVSMDIDDIQSLGDVGKALFDKSNLDIDEHIKEGLGISGGPDIEAIINSYDRDDEEFAATFDGADYDRAVELRDDAYEMRSKLSDLSLRAYEIEREKEQEKEEQEQNKDKSNNKGIDR